FFPVYILQNDTQYSLGGSNNAEDANESGTGFDFRTSLGWVFWDRMIVGLAYNYYKASTSKGATSVYEAVSTTSSKSEYGPIIGYKTGGWRFVLSYFINAERSLDAKATDQSGTVVSDVTENRTKGTGYQLTIGYSFAISSNFEIGPSLVYRSVTYGRGSRTNRLDNTDSFDDSDLQTKAIDVGLSPMISLIAKF
ncbi:MAG TPA: hypothetical protein VFV50_09455, partial [Bdellovibrionales bacterium]|nr:hypothetical protein [Bdellovibrionales bacterium]